MIWFDLTRFDASDVTIRLGEYDFDKRSSHERDFRVAKIFMHEQYDRRTYNNDIAILKLETKVAFTQHIWPICLPPSNLPDLTNEITSVTGKKPYYFNRKTRPEWIHYI